LTKKKSALISTVLISKRKYLSHPTQTIVVYTAGILSISLDEIQFRKQELRSILF